MTRHNAPVNEVVVAVSFSRQELLIGPLFPGILGATFADRSAVRSAASYRMPSESESRSGVWASNVLPFQIEQSDSDPRYFITSSDSSYITQVQPDYLAVSWRRQQADHYVGYDKVRRQFEQVLTDVTSGLARQGVDLSPTRAELTYVNLISPNTTWHNLSETHNVFAVRLGKQEDYELLAFNFTRKVLSSEGKFRGRIHVSLQPGVDLRKEELNLHLNITVRSADFSSGVQDLFGFLDDAHELANETFLRLLTPAAIDNWRLQ